MASSAAQPSPSIAPAPAPLPALVAAARSVFFGLLWGAALLLIYALWLGNKYGEDRRPIVAWTVDALSSVSLGLAVWHAVTLWVQKLAPDAKLAALAAQRRITGMSLLAGGVGLVVIAIYLGFVQRSGGAGGTGFATFRANFGETVSLFLFALVALGTGARLLQPPHGEPTAVDLEPVRGLFPLIRTILFFAGVVLVIVFAVLVFYYKFGAAAFPELAGLLLFSMLCLAMALWITSIPAPDAFSARIFVLVFGGFTGLILFVMTLARAVAWRGEVFGGVAAWQGEDVWRLWLCVYLMLIALALMFGSLLVARADIRSNATLRRVLFGYNTILEGLLMVAILIVVNIVFYAMVPYTFDWTKSRGLHALAESTKNLLHGLKQPTHAYVLMSPSSGGYAEVRTLLDNMEAESNKFKVSYISPDRTSFEYETLAQKFPQILPSTQEKRMGDESGRGILLVYGELPKEDKHRVPYTFVPERKVYDEPGGHGAKAKRVFKGEGEVVKELNFLVHGKEKRKIYFLQGDGELEMSLPGAARRYDALEEMSSYGAFQLVDKLKKDNFEIQGMTFSKEYALEHKKVKEDILYAGESGPDKKPEVPREADTLIIAGPSRPFSAETIGALEKFMDRGGRLLVLFDIVLTHDVKALKLTGLEAMLRKYGIESTDEFALRVPDRQGVDPFKIIATAPEKADNALAKQFLHAVVDFRSARVIRPSAAPGRFKAEVVIESLPPLGPAVADKDVAALRNVMRFLTDLKNQGTLLERMTKPLPLAVAVSEGDKGRMVVFGDTDFVSNYGLATDRQGTNYALFVSALEWMADRGGGVIGPLPKTTESFSIDKNVALNYSPIHLVPTWLMFLSITTLGIGVWLVRRR